MNDQNVIYQYNILFRKKRYRKKVQIKAIMWATSKVLLKVKEAKHKR
jgi:hypothetical protein